MKGLLIKNSLYFAIFALLYCSGVWFYWTSARTALDIPMIITHVSFMFILAPLPIFMSETAEDRMKGYRFLDTLPLTSREIVSAKMVLPLMSLAVFTAWSIFMYSRFDAGPGMLGFARISLFTAALACLAECGLLYIGIYRFGCHRMNWIMIAALIAGYLAPIAANELLVPRIGLDRVMAASLAGRLDWRILTAASLALYAALWEAAVRVKERKRGSWH